MTTHKAISTIHLPSSRCFQPVSRYNVSPRTSITASRSRDRSIQVFAQQNFATQLVGGALGGANEVLIAGAEGQLGARVVQKLLQAGFKVAAGVSDVAEAQSVVDFAASVELLKKQEVQKLRLEALDLNDEESVASVLRRGARVVAIAGDQTLKGPKLNGGAVTRLLEASQEASVRQFVLVAPTGSSGGGGFLGGLFGGGGGSIAGSGRKPSRTEQDIASSGLDFIIIRTARPEAPGAAAPSETNVALGGQGSLPGKASISQAQVAEVVQQVLRQADTDILIEAWASADAPKLDIEDAVAQALPTAKIEEAEVEEEEEDDELPDPQEAVEEAAKEPQKAARSLFGGFGTKKIKAGGDDSAPVELPVPTGRQKQRPAPKPRVPLPKAEAEESDGNGAAPKRNPFGFGRKKEVPQEEEEEDSKGGNPLAGLFGGGKKDEQADVSPEGARKSAAKGAKAATRAAKKSPPAQKLRQIQKEDAKPQKKGFLASIGLNTEKYDYIDEDN